MISLRHNDLDKLADQNINKTSFGENFSIAEEDFKRLNGWTFIGMLLLESKNSIIICKKTKEIKQITSTEELTLANGMFKNFILSYSKCFSSSGKNKISLDANDIYSSRPDLKIIHDKILEARNKYVAHNDDENGYDTAIAYTS